jgi:hypothetical protein
MNAPPLATLIPTFAPGATFTIPGSIFASQKSVTLPPSRIT